MKQSPDELRLCQCFCVRNKYPKSFFVLAVVQLVWLSITNYRACQWRCFKKSRVMLHLEESHGQDDSRVFSNTSLCVPGSVGSDHRGEPAGDFCSVQRCVCALEVWQIRPGERPCVHKHTHAYTHTQHYSISKHRIVVPASSPSDPAPVTSLLSSSWCG